MAIQQNQKRIRTTHIGSLPRPHAVLDLLKPKLNGQPYDERCSTRLSPRRSPTR